MDEFPSSVPTDLSDGSWHQYRVENDERPSTAIVRAVGTLSGLCVTEMRPLSDVVDPEAIDGLLQNGEVVSMRAAFVFEECQVCVTPDTVYIRGRGHDPRDGEVGTE